MQRQQPKEQKNDRLQHKLPETLHRHILSFCAADDLANMSAVNMYWYCKASYPKLWIELATNYKLTRHSLIKIHLENHLPILCYPINERIISLAIKQDSARHLSLEETYQRNLMEFSKNYPTIVGAIEYTPAALCKLAFAVSAFPFTPAQTQAIADRVADYTPKIHVIGFFAGRVITFKNTAVNEVVSVGKSAVKAVADAVLTYMKPGI